MPVTIHIVDAFTQTVGQGSRAGVVLKAAGFSVEKMQVIAKFAGYSETAFVMPATGPDHALRVRYFTPNSEVPICGHATVATHFLRAELENLPPSRFSVRTGAGVLPVEIQGLGAERRIVMTQAAPQFGDVLTANQVAALCGALGIAQTDLHVSLPVQIVSTGHSKVMVPLRDQATLDGVRPNMTALANLSAEIGCNGFFPFATGQMARGSGQAPDGQNPEPDFCTFGRMFAPAIGIDEDPVTGNANGPAGACLWHYGQLPVIRQALYAGHQGHAMGKPGTVFVSLKAQEGNAPLVQVGGHAVLVNTRICGEHLYKDT